MYDHPDIAYSSHHKTLPVILVYREFHRVWQYCSVSLWVPWHFLDSALHHVVTHIVKSRELHHVVLGANFNNAEKTTRKGNSDSFLWNALYDTSHGTNKRGRNCFAISWDEIMVLPVLFFEDSRQLTHWCDNVNNAERRDAYGNSIEKQSNRCNEFYHQNKVGV